MIKRPINSIFREKILAKEKISTIRVKQWPLCTPIMLFSWEDKPYRSKHKDLAVITVQVVIPIAISRSAKNALIYSYSSREGSCSEMSIFGKPLFQIARLLKLLSLLKLLQPKRECQWKQAFLILRFLKMKPIEYIEVQVSIPVKRYRTDAGARILSRAATWPNPSFFFCQRITSQGGSL